jgi:hypothetical protein
MFKNNTRTKVKVNFFKRTRMLSIGIGYSYITYDSFHNKKHAGHTIECHFIKWTMTITWDTKPNAKI